MPLSKANNPAWAVWVCVLVPIALWASLLSQTYAAVPWIISWDSAAYIETAQSILAGRGFQQRIYEGLTPEIWMPMSWWPPGFPVLLAATEFVTRAATPTSCLILAALSGGLSVALLGLVSARLFHWAIALPLTIAATAATGFMNLSAQCMSDTSYNVLVLASVACLIMWTTGPKWPALWLFLAGLLAGAGWVTRNVGLALFAGTGVFLLCHSLWLPRVQVVRTIVVWASGVAVMALPLIAHNVVTFGGLSGYSMPPSELSLHENIIRGVEVIVRDFTTLGSLGRIASQHLIVSVVVLAIVCAATVYPLYRGHTLAAFVERYKLPLLLLTYAGATGGVVVLARTKYRWSELIDSRHLTPAYWAVWISLAILALALLRTSPMAKRATAIVSAVFVVVAGLQVREHVSYVTRPFTRAESVEARLGTEACEYLKATVPQSQIVLSTRAEFLRAHCNVRGRKIAGASQAYRLAQLTRDVLYETAASGLLWGLVIEDKDAALKGEFGETVQAFAERPNEQVGFSRIEVASPAIILRWVGPLAAR